MTGPVQETRSMPVVEQLMAHIRTKFRLRYVGDCVVGINRRPFPLHIFQSFVDAHPNDFPRRRRIDGSLAPAGQRNEHYQSFRDHWLKQALRRIRAEDAGVPVEEVPETEYERKLIKNADGQVTDVTTRSIKGWVKLTAENVDGALPPKKRRLAKQATADAETDEDATPLPPKKRRPAEGANVETVADVAASTHGGENPYERFRRLYATRER